MWTWDTSPLPSTHQPLMAYIGPCHACGARVARDIAPSLTRLEAGTTELLCMSCQFPEESALLPFVSKKEIKPA